MLLLYTPIVADCYIANSLLGAVTTPIAALAISISLQEMVVIRVKVTGVIDIFIFIYHAEQSQEVASAFLLQVIAAFLPPPKKKDN